MCKSICDMCTSKMVEACLQFSILIEAVSCARFITFVIKSGTFSLKCVTIVVVRTVSVRDKCEQHTRAGHPMLTHTRDGDALLLATIYCPTCVNSSPSQCPLACECESANFAVFLFSLTTVLILKTLPFQTPQFTCPMIRPPSSAAPSISRCKRSPEL